MRITKHTVVLVLAMGVVALLLEVSAGLISVPLQAMLGDMWMSRVRHSLIDAGLASEFVTGYVSFLLLQVPIWIVLVATAFCLGLLAGPMAKVAALSLICWLPVVDFVTDVWSHLVCFRGWYPEGVTSKVILGFNTQVVPAIITVALGLAAWFLGYLLRSMTRMKVGRDSKQPAQADG